MRRIYVDRFVTGELASNCYALSQDHSDQAIIIDPGASSDEVTEWFTTHQKSCSAILLTHGHFDHVGGVLELVLNWNCPFYLYPKDAFLLNRAKETTEHFLGVAADPVPTNFVPLEDAELLSFDSPSHPLAVDQSNSIDPIDFLESVKSSDLNNSHAIEPLNSSINIRIIHTPGHTPGSCSFLLDSSFDTEIFFGVSSVGQSQLLFTGDTWFPEEPTDVSHSYSRPADLKRSLATLKHIARVKPTLLCPGHGEPVML